MVTAAMKLKDTCSWKKSKDKPRQHIKNQRYYFAYKGLYSQRYGFTSSHEQIESWPIKLSPEELMPLNCDAGEVP